MPEYISITEASKEKSTTRQTIYNAIYRKELDIKKIADKQVIIKNQKYEAYQPKKFKD
jgi:predicted DNA-binding protein YlxM (UPF0122 family)